jgi:hypothetical protein
MCEWCNGQMLTCGCRFDEDDGLDDDLDDDWRDDLGVDGNGCITETRHIGGQSVVVHYDDVPETDITVVDGVRTTTALRTVIDLAVSVRPAELESMLQNCLKRGLFTIDDARRRMAQRDMRDRPGAAIFLAMVERLGS